MATRLRPAVHVSWRSRVEEMHPGYPTMPILRDYAFENTGARFMAGLYREDTLRLSYNT